jgi:Fe-S-cluster containining protein
MANQEYSRKLMADFDKHKSADYPENKKKIEELKKRSSGAVDEFFHEKHEEVFSGMDCLECANCCKTISPIIMQEDMDALAKHLRISVTQLLKEYIEMDEDGDFVFKQTPCPFLDTDNKCKVYESRPKACKQYPHTNSRKMKQILDLTLQNSLTCPAVWKMLGSFTV